MGLSVHDIVGNDMIATVRTRKGLEFYRGSGYWWLSYPDGKDTASDNLIEFLHEVWQKKIWEMNDAKR